MKYVALITSIIFSSLLPLPCSAIEAAASSPVEKSDPVLAVVGGVAQIRASDFIKEAAKLPDNLKELVTTPNGKKEMLDTMIIREMILLEAKKAKIENDPAVIAKLHDLKMRVIVETFLKANVEAKSDVSKAELTEFYNKNKDSFVVAEETKLSIITVDNDVMAEGIIAKIKGGAGFEELAKQYSTDKASGATGGDIGWVSAENLHPAVAEAAAKLGENEYSRVVKTEAGFHVVKLAGKRRNHLHPLSEVEDQVRKLAMAAKQQETFVKLKGDLRAKYDVQTDDKAFEKVTGGAK